MTLHFKCTAQPSPNIHQAGIFFTRAHQQLRTLIGQFFNFKNRIFVRAVLAPHHRINAKLGKGGHAAKVILNHFKFFFIQSMVDG